MQHAPAQPVWDLVEETHSSWTDVRFDLQGAPGVPRAIGRKRLFTPKSGLCVRRVEDGRLRPDSVWLWGDGDDFAHFDRRPELEKRPDWVLVLADAVITGTTATTGHRHTETDRQSGADHYWKHRISGAPRLETDLGDVFHPDTVVLAASRSTRDEPGPGWAKFRLHALALDPATKRLHSTIADGPMADAAHLLPAWIADRLAVLVSV